MVKEVEQSQIPAKQLYDYFVNNGVSYFCGVPDTLLSSFGLYIEEHAPRSHDVAINEGNAVALAIGHYIATTEIPLVYMQNSGLGNAVNPLTSLADPLIMGIPMILLIGWRGQPGNKDEPQHQKQGRITIPLLETLGIPNITLPHNPVEAAKYVAKALNEAKRLSQPYAIVIEANTIEPYQKPNEEKVKHPLSREDVIGHIVGSLSDSDAVVATTGKASRELFEVRSRQGADHRQDLLIVGGMGHASAIALNIAKQKPNKKVYCIDGDGAVLMHMGVLATIGQSRLENFYHLVINNGAHESVGGQRTLGFDINMPEIAKACGYTYAYSLSQSEDLKHALEAIRKLKGPIFMEIRVNLDSRENLTRPNIRPQQNKNSFMTFLDEE